ncbi:MAG: MOSC domain-containing protein [Saprospiraceae bacterium]|nr:MOSC domain-containing protein [Saprospiraceae bacterium]
MMDKPHLQAIYIYPVKSLAGIRISESKPTTRGLEYDRRWMLVDEDGVFLSQRSHPQMALLQQEIKGNQLHFSSPKSSSGLSISLFGPTTYQIQDVQIWEDSVDALVYKKEINDWFTKQLGSYCQLVYMPEGSRRIVDPNYARNNDIVSFADGFPYLIATKASLQDLNKKLSTPIQMSRFRPNLVIGGSLTPWEEDNWQAFQIGAFHFQYTKPCARCQVITIDPFTATSGAEPLRTMSGFRKRDNKVLFGLNACLALPLPSNDLPPLAIGDTVHLST